MFMNPWVGPGTCIWPLLFVDAVLRICLLAQIFCNFRISTRKTFAVDICRYTQSGEIFELPHRHSPAEVQQGRALPSCFSSPTENTCPFRGLWNAALWCFLSVISLFKRAPRVVLKCCLSVAEEGRDVPPGESTCVRLAFCKHKLQCCWLASSVLMN